MEIINSLNSIRDSFLFIIAAIILLIIGFLGSFFIIRHFKNRDEQAKGITEDGKNYRDRKTENAEDFVPIDDITENMVIDEDYTRFTALITTTGTDFYNLGMAEQLQIQRGYEGFLRATKDRWAFYHLSENVDLENVKNGLHASIRQIEENLFSAGERYRKLRSEYDRNKAKNEPAPESLIDEMLRLQTRISGFQMRLQEAKAELSFADTFDSPDRNVEKSVLVYTFSWVYRPGLLEKRLEGQALTEKANTELDRITGQYISLLSSSGITARRMTTEEIIELCYAHTHPVTCGQWKLSRYFAHQVSDGDIIRTKTVARKRKEWKDSLVDQIMFGKKRQGV